MVEIVIIGKAIKLSKAKATDQFFDAGSFCFFCDFCFVAIANLSCEGHLPNRVCFAKLQSESAHANAQIWAYLQAY